jgi:hypothetical protein
MRASRFAEHNGWEIDAAPTILAKDRLFVSSAVIKRNAGERFVFTDLGNPEYRWQAHERGIEWAKRWIDNNFEVDRARMGSILR